MDVLIDRASVSVRLTLAISLNGASGFAVAVSRMRSKTTIVSCTLKPMMVRRPTMNMVLISVPATFPRMENTPRMMRASCPAAMIAARP